MAALERDAIAHRRRVLEHQAKVEAERGTAVPNPSEAQLKIPLIGEVKPSGGAEQLKRKRGKTPRPVQPELGKL
jgi:hypothetical protein